MRPEGLEPPAYRFEACRSIQLSYGRTPNRTLTCRFADAADCTLSADEARTGAAGRACPERTGHSTIARTAIQAMMHGIGLLMRGGWQ